MTIATATRIQDLADLMLTYHGDDIESLAFNYASDLSKTVDVEKVIQDYEELINDAQGVA